LRHKGIIDCVLQWAIVLHQPLSLQLRNLIPMPVDIHYPLFMNQRKSSRFTDFPPPLFKAAIPEQSNKTQHDHAKPQSSLRAISDALSL